MADSNPASATPKAEPIDVRAEQLAGVYARALLAAGEKSGVTDEIVEQYDLLVNDLFAKTASLEAVLAATGAKDAARIALIDRVFAGKFSKLFVNFLKVLATRGRLDMVRAIHRAFHKELDLLRGRLRVRVSTASPIGNDVADQLLKSLHPLLDGGSPRIERVVDPTLIGGVVVRIGDVVYDGSVARQLGQMREQMINRSIHEIQSRRDRFRHTGGN